MTEPEPTSTADATPTAAAHCSTGAQPLVSVVVTSYNYEPYLGCAIDSALGQRYAAVEVIVVDDGSSDGSRALIEGYGDRVRAVLKENGGQASAMNAGFVASEGELLMFLDADDFLHPDAVARVAAAWTPTCAKVQFRLSVVDEAGVRRGCEPPAHVPLPQGDLVGQLLAAGRYVTPVTTGNAYRRAVLSRLLPIPERDFPISADGYLNGLCPFYGPVVSIDAELGGYRQHGENAWAFTKTVTMEQVRARVRHDLVKQRYLEAAAREFGRSMTAEVALRDPAHGLMRLGSLRLEPARHPVPTDRIPPVTRALIASLRQTPELPLVDRLFFASTALSLVALPRVLSRRMMDFAIASRPRPRWLRLLARSARRAHGLVRRRPHPDPEPIGSGRG